MVYALPLHAQVVRRAHAAAAHTGQLEVSHGPPHPLYYRDVLVKRQPASTTVFYGLGFEV